MSDLDTFLRVSSQYRLGDLPTEKPHPVTVGLSSMDLPEAIHAFITVEEEAVGQLHDNSEVRSLFEFIKKAMNSGGRLFLAGCGATGRLAISLETFFRTLCPDQGGKIVSFMAGGDVAFIRSVEDFEDFPQYGARQLRDLGFRDTDYLLGITEGGETPFVLGAVGEAFQIAGANVGVAFTNPEDILSATLKRCRDIFENPGIKTFSFPIGPMVLAGSTRLQSTTVLEYLVGGALFFENFDDLRASLDRFVHCLSQIERSRSLQAMISWERDRYIENKLVTYVVPPALACHLLTDTTERSPTFCLTPFMETGKGEGESAVYLVVRGTRTSQEAWFELLKRAPRTVEWKETLERTGNERLLRFNLSEEAHERRKSSGTHHTVEWNLDEHRLKVRSDDLDIWWDLPQSWFEKQMLIKVILNCHSTIMFGKLARYDSNIMTWVRPSNFKLIDRAIRYAGLYLEQRGINPSYEELAQACFEIKEDLPYEESIVLKMIERFSG